MPQVTSSPASAVKNTSVTLEPDVLAYLEELRDESERSRSWLINRIVKQHREHRERARLTSARGDIAAGVALV